jgi:hypothetical protein
MRSQRINIYDLAEQLQVGLNAELQCQLGQIRGRMGGRFSRLR